ncbi:sulfotransferase family protein [Litchfieldella qijiaojingensis]|uniref:Sulfotransferase family protein n=1 Tax=Litchfieldella qijiaojingensis TaxID=980347 RepID=A0ABQ2Z3S1_9GAMM|nr:sulfotransferase [Halomonas qijiaojingensis]GGY01629.1 sulfotransferase family protein [Halomonas qijiaojingensis]
MSRDQTELRTPHPRLSHPLMGADIGTLLQQFATHRPLPMHVLPFVAMTLASALVRTPFSLCERAWTAARTRHQEMPSPVFIVGHWRSGTTHLYNLLSRDPRFAFVSPLATGLPWDFCLLGRVLRPLLERALPEHRFIDQVKVASDAPQEDEIALASMQTLSFYHGLYFPQRLEWWFDRGVFFDGASVREIRCWRRQIRYFYRKHALMQPGRQLLIKNPVYTARVKELVRLWPDARFIHIHRNPYVVFQSTRHFYRKLLHELALQPYDESHLDELILSRYPRMMQRLIDDVAELPASHAVEIGFDTLEQAPLETLRGIYAALGLGSFTQVQPHVEAYLAELGEYRKNQYLFPPTDNQRVSERWRSFIEHWGYATSPTQARLDPEVGGVVR